MTIALPWPWSGRARPRPANIPAPVAPAPGGAAMTDARFGGGDNEPTEWECVYVAATIEEAHVVKGALEAADIPVVLRYESLGVVVGALTLGGVDVLVPRALADRARSVVDVGDGPAPRRRRRRRRSDR